MCALAHRESHRDNRRPPPPPVPSLSFSVATPSPTEEDNGLFSAGGICVAVSSPETSDHPSIQVSDDADDEDDGGTCVDIPEAAPLIPSIPQTKVSCPGTLKDSVTSPQGQSTESTPLLGGLGIPMNTARRSSTHIGLTMENGNMPSDLGSSISSFLRSKSENENLAQISANTSSMSIPNHEDIEMEDKEKDPKLQDVATTFVTDVISKAQEEALKKKAADQTCADDLRSDPRMLEMVRGFVAEILSRARQEAYDKKARENNNNNNNNNIVFKLRQSIPKKLSGEGRVGGPWYIRMGRYLTSLFGRVCPCSNNSK